MAFQPLGSAAGVSPKRLEAKGTLTKPQPISHAGTHGCYFGSYLPVKLVAISQCIHA